MTTIALRQSRVAVGAVWALQILVAVLFTVAGVSKLGGASAMVQMFGAIGLGQWFRYATGAIEVGAAALLLVPSAARYGAAVLAATMVGAIVTHLFIIGGNPAIPVALLISTVAIAWARRGDR